MAGNSTWVPPMHGPNTLPVREVLTGLSHYCNGTQVRGAFDAYRLHSDSSLLLRGGSFDGEVFLRGAKISGDVSTARADFKKNVEASDMTIGGSLFLRDGSFDGEVLLRGTKISGYLSSEGARFKENVIASGMMVGGSLFLRNATFGGEVLLRDTKLSGDLSSEGARFNKDADASSMTVGGSLLLREGTFDSPVYVTFAHIGRSLDLTNSTVRRLDLTGTVVVQDLVLGVDEMTLKWRCMGIQGGVQPSTRRWPLGDPRRRYSDCTVGGEYGDAPWLGLRDAHVGSLMDSIDAWPPNLDLDGFKYDRLGRFGGEYAADLRARSPQQWQDWLERDHTYNPQLYAQLATTLVSIGQSDTADAIRHYGLERARAAAWTDGRLTQWLGLSVLPRLARISHTGE